MTRLYYDGVCVHLSLGKGVVTYVKYKTGVAMREDYPLIHVAAVRYRLARLFRSDSVARTDAGLLIPLIDEWHRLQATEA